MDAKSYRPPSHEEIATYAYYLWEFEGRPEGQQVDFWLQAEAHLKATRQFEAGLIKEAISGDSTEDSSKASRVEKPQRKRPPSSKQPQPIVPPGQPETSRRDVSRPSLRANGPS